MTSSSSPPPLPSSPALQHSAAPAAAAAAAVPITNANTSTGITTESTTEVSKIMATKFTSHRSLKVLSRMAGGAVVLALPVGYWWYNARQERDKVAENVRTKIRIPGGQESMDEIMIEKHCQAGDVVVFDRRCDTCATSPWAALACFTSRQFLCDNNDNNNKDHRHFNHMGLIVPGYINSRHDAHDATNLLLLEATPSGGIVARPLLSRLEHSQARSVWLLQLACPGERRQTSTSTNSSSSRTKNKNEPDSPQRQQQQQQQSKSVREARQHVERQLITFRNTWTELSREQNYAYMHSTLCLGGALAYQTGLLKQTSQVTSSPIYKGPVSPSAWLCFMGLQHANAAQNIHDAHRQMVRVQDFVNVSTTSRNYASSSPSSNSEDVLRLRPGWRFLAPIPLRENNAPRS